MIKASNRLASLLHRLGVSGPAHPARVRASDGIGPSKIRLLVTLAATTAFFAFTGTALAAGPPEIGPGGEFTSPQPNPSEEVRFEAAINPNKEPTKCDFQYGETAAYGHEAACTEPVETAEGTEQRAAVTVTGLKAGTTYHYRVVLKNASGEAKGPDAEAKTAPETPETGKANPASITATTATLEDGVLNPHAALGELAEYEYRFRISPTECEGESSTAGMAAGGLKEKVPPVELMNLQPDEEYTFCLFERSLATGETSTASTPAHFTTKPAPPKIDSESAGANSTEATLFAQVNPNNEPTKYVFEYSTTEANKKLTGTITTLTGGSELSGGSDQTAEAATGAVLEAGKTYYYRVVAANAQSEKEPHPAEGAVEQFTTVPTPTTDPVTAIADTTATFNGHLTPLNPTTATQYHFDYKLSGSECTGESETPSGEAGKGAGGGASEATPVTGLAPDRLYTVCFVTANASGSQVGPPVTFRTLPETYTTNVASSSATLHAVLDPEGAGPTTYRFEYGTSTAYTLQTTEGSIEASGSVTVEAHIQELTPGAVYHFRVSATNAAPETIAGEDRTFTTQGVGGSTNQSFALPDGRQWEMVSPPDKHGALILPLREEGVVEAAAHGGAFTYLTYSPTESEPQGYETKVQVVAARGGGGGWSNQDIETPHDVATGVSVGISQEYQAFSPDLSQALIRPQGPFTPLSGEEVSPEASENTVYLRANSTCQATPATCYTPLVTKANTPPGTEIEGKTVSGGGLGAGLGGITKSLVTFVGATPDLSHVLLQTESRQQGAPAPALIAGAPETSLYEWAGGQLQLVSVLPAAEGGAPATKVSLGSVPPQDTPETRNAISENGSRVIWSTNNREKGKLNLALYMSDTAGGKTETVRLDLPEQKCLEAGTCGTVGKRPDGYEESAVPEFDIASSDGSEVFFTDTQRLTADSRAGSGETTGGDKFEEPDLYACNMEEVEVAGHRQLKCDVTDLTPDTNPDGERANVQGDVLGASEDGSYVYFVANGLLGDADASGASAGDCGPIGGRTFKEKTELEAKETCNLYAKHYNGSGWEAPTFIATLSGEDLPDWRYARLESHTSRVSPDGRYLAFSSQRSLTGYDNTDVNEHPTKNEEEGVSAGTKVKRHDQEVYLYHAAESLATESGTLVCASCTPTGARPLGELGEKPNLVIPNNKTWVDNQWLAADVPGWESYQLPQGVYQPRYLSDSGRLFFNSDDPLVPDDVNGTWDVYEYEPEGDGPESARCGPQASSGSDVFEPAGTVDVEGHDVQLGAGCVGLISSGESSEESAFLDASESGGDVFFLTASQLVPQDIDHSYDVYDAHECGAEGVPCTTAPEVPPPCTTEASCKPAPEPQPSIYGAPSSATFNGPGNLAPPVPAVVKKVTTKTVKCRKGFVKKKVKKKETCVKKKSKKSAHKSAKARH